MRDERTKQMPVLVKSTGNRGSKDPFTHSKTAWNAVSDSQTNSYQYLGRKTHLRKSPRLLKLGLQRQQNHLNKSNLGCQLNQPQTLMHGSSQQGHPSQISSLKTTEPSFIPTLSSIIWPGKSDPSVSGGSPQESALLYTGAPTSGQSR
jgi:hypothetical protein